MLTNFDFKARHVMVFGGTTGINFGIARAFAIQGAYVTVVSRKRSNVDAAASTLSKITPHVLGLCADVRDADAVEKALSEAKEKFGLLDVLISGAAGNFLCEAKNISPNGFKTVVDIDLIGTFNVVRQAYCWLRKPGSSVINISAPQGLIPTRFQAHACAAKAGIDQLTRVLALEWGTDGIRVNAISPGPIEGTEGLERLIASDDAARSRASDAVPLKRLGSVADVANLATFLASPYASYISGAVIPCDGGGAIDSVKLSIETAGAVTLKR
jgi:NAD(P)-dependent dehydrogenase (short-subunit alcohol dehydrogenase family)